MLYTFGLSNYKSYDLSKDYTDQLLDLCPADLRSKQEHINTEGLLRTAVIFGSNAAGKSNMVDGLRFIKGIITENCLPKGSNQFYCNNHESNSDRPISFIFQILVKTDDFLNEGSTDDSLIGSEEHIVSPERTFVQYEISLTLKDSKKGYHISHESLKVLDGRDTIQYCTRDSPESKYEVETNISDLKFEIRAIEDRIASLRSKMEENLPVDDMSYEEKDLFMILNDVDNDGNRELQNEIDSLHMELRTKKKTLSEEGMKMINLRSDQSFLSYDPDLDNLKKTCVINDTVKSIYLTAVIKAVFHWFDYNLEIIDPYGFVLPELDTESFEKISKKIKDFDVNIDRVGWIDMTNAKSISAMLSRLHPKEIEQIRKCHYNSIRDKVECSTIVGNLSGIYKFSYWRGEQSVKELVTYHGTNVPHHLEEESDGTKRIIELASILLNQKSDKTYIVDELDRRLHPLLTKRFMELFLQDTTEESDNKQLIITTHETRLLTTKMFRADEIWFVDRDDEGCSTIHRASESGVPFDKRLDRLYLEDGLFGGIPLIGKRTDS